MTVDEMGSSPELGSSKRMASGEVMMALARADNGGGFSFGNFQADVVQDMEISKRFADFDQFDGCFFRCCHGFPVSCRASG